MNYVDVTLHLVRRTCVVSSFYIFIVLDYLRLNVYSRNVNTEKKRDVIIYIQPGGFYVFSGRTDVFDPQHLMDHDIVLVTINYRLGTLGTLTKDAPGNMGFKSKSIQNNIDKFGGNPNSVTLLGYSAGAFSNSLHLVSKMSQGLATKEDYANTLPSMFEFPESNPTLLYYPVVEPDFGQDRFLTDNPTYITQNATLREQISKNILKLAPIRFLYERDTPRSEEISARLQSFYFGNSTSDDWLTTSDDWIPLQMMGLKTPHTKVFHYKFSYTGRYSWTYYPGDKPYGAVRHDELLYLFYVSFQTPLFNTTDPENQMVQKMTGWWTNFARSGTACKISIVKIA
ncbi:juvenile hormone esterase-like [Contarinia nasturtii]|uniref:juvenile hormone esterase-like n=1 Tax=Contarinia nasturtii TaxID=265458 RepID=UPI0012D3AE6E|nr:juvenile hormone esterase-like [Contarinia nasturtii]